MGRLKNKMIIETLLNFLGVIFLVFAFDLFTEDQWYFVCPSFFLGIHLIWRSGRASAQTEQEVKEMLKMKQSK